MEKSRNFQIIYAGRTHPSKQTNWSTKGKWRLYTPYNLWARYRTANPHNVAPPPFPWIPVASKAWWKGIHCPRDTLPPPKRGIAKLGIPQPPHYPIGVKPVHVNSPNVHSNSKQRSCIQFITNEQVKLTNLLQMRGGRFHAGNTLCTFKMPSWSSMSTPPYRLEANGVRHFVRFYIITYARPFNIEGILNL